MFTAKTATLALAALTFATVGAHGQGSPAAGSADPPAATPAGAPSADDAKALAVLNTSCVGCHDLGMLTARPHRADEWPIILQQMVANGANVSDDDQHLLARYLAKTYSAH